ncbi:hypothetical protein BC830DRAFT_1167508 [Chytriomyces sp. MP71]|nr:hypothetical protein BC830DRAFT_1167508 [Chytriomyces sp. MP71]
MPRVASSKQRGASSSRSIAGKVTASGPGPLCVAGSRPARTTSFLEQLYGSGAASSGRAISSEALCLNTPELNYPQVEEPIKLPGESGGTGEGPPSIANTTAATAVKLSTTPSGESGERRYQGESNAGQNESVLHKNETARQEEENLERAIATLAISGG